MQIDIRIHVLGCAADAPVVLGERLRRAMGSYTAEVRRVSLVLKADAPGVSGTGHVRLRGQRVLEVATEGRNLAEACELLCKRIASTVARHVDTERMLRS